ncbi:MAG TPA: hypothetical protein VG897_14825 [Terriglobales bacterium]|nr:hypothetical protein [Terriglobales bacterium]
MFSDPLDPLSQIANDKPDETSRPEPAMRSFSLLFGIIGAVVVIAGLLLDFGVRFTSDAMTYDAAKEFVTSGTIVGFDEFACPAADGELERHLRLKTDSKEYEVHLAPSRVMRSVGWQFNAGTKIDVRGVPVRFRGKDGMLARQITIGDNIYTLRNQSGQLLIQQ